jgi:hypothetical protein
MCRFHAQPLTNSAWLNLVLQYAVYPFIICKIRLDGWPPARSLNKLGYLVPYTVTGNQHELARACACQLLLVD